MARRYKKRYKKQDDDILSGVAIVGGLFFFGALMQARQGNSGPLLLIIGTLLVLAIGVGGIVYWKHTQTQRRLRALDIAAIGTMDPLEFEVYVAKLLKQQGYRNIRLTEKFDYGVDIIAEKDDVRWGVQVKRYNNLVKAEAIRQVVTALIRYKCDRSMVVTNSTFSRPARELAADNRCVLIDRDILTEWIVQFQDAVDKQNRV